MMHLYTRHTYMPISAFALLFCRMEGLLSWWQVSKGTFLWLKHFWSTVPPLTSRMRCGDNTFQCIMFQSSAYLLHGLHDTCLSSGKCCTHIEEVNTTNTSTEHLSCLSTRKVQSTKIDLVRICYNCLRC